MTDHYRVLLVEDDPALTEDFRLVLVPADRAAAVPVRSGVLAPDEPSYRLPAALTAALPTDRPWTTLIVQEHPARRIALTAYFHRGGWVSAVADHDAAVALPETLHPDLIVLPLPTPGPAGSVLTSLLRARYPHSRLAYTSVLGAEPPAPAISGSNIQRPKAIATPINSLATRARRPRRSLTGRAPSSA
jgi:CheY-like chemotaxis protein